jgi:hypothetical protein
MASLSLQSLLVASACLIISTSAINADLVGTWSTKSAKVLTGPVRSILGTRGGKVGNEGTLRAEELILGYRAFTILSTTVLLNQVLRGSRIRSLRMGFMRRHTTELSRTVRWSLDREELDRNILMKVQLRTHHVPKQ